MSSVRKKLAGPKKDPLPAQILVGDRIKVKEDRVVAIRTACQLAGFDVTIDRDRVLTVERVLEKGPASPHGRQLIVAEFRQPTFWNEDVELAWEKQSAQRRRALVVAGSWIEVEIEEAAS